MAAEINPRDRERLSKVLAMLSSSHEGERATAALKADQLIKDLGLSWSELAGLEGEQKRPKQQQSDLIPGSPEWREEALRVKRMIGYLSVNRASPLLSKGDVQMVRRWAYGGVWPSDACISDVERLYDRLTAAEQRRNEK